MTTDYGTRWQEVDRLIAQRGLDWRDKNDWRERPTLPRFIGPFDWRDYRLEWFDRRMLCANVGPYDDKKMVKLFYRAADFKLDRVRAAYAGPEGRSTLWGSTG
jgi:hypothetical protein